MKCSVWSASRTRLHALCLITGYQTEMGSTVERLQNEGVDAICYKPFDIPDLLNTLERLAEGRSS